jgi:hypothetical protein
MSSDKASDFKSTASKINGTTVNEEDQPSLAMKKSVSSGSINLNNLDMNMLSNKVENMKSHEIEMLQLKFEKMAERVTLGDVN